METDFPLTPSRICCDLLRLMALIKTAGTFVFVVLRVPQIIGYIKKKVVRPYDEQFVPCAQRWKL